MCDHCNESVYLMRFLKKFLVFFDDFAKSFALCTIISFRRHGIWLVNLKTLKQKRFSRCSVTKKYNLILLKCWNHNNNICFSRVHKFLNSKIFLFAGKKTKNKIAWRSSVGSIQSQPSQMWNTEQVEIYGPTHALHMPLRKRPTRIVSC